MTKEEEAIRHAKTLEQEAKELLARVALPYMPDDWAGRFVECVVTAAVLRVAEMQARALKKAFPDSSSESEVGEHD